jgi:PAS domain S-box-containing protein
MTIRKKLNLIILIVLVLSIFFSVSIHLFLKEYEQAVAESATANLIASEILERRLFADDYLLNPGERSRQQWYAKQNELEILIENNFSKFENDEESELVEKIQTNFSHSKDIFSQIADLKGQETNSEKQSRLVAELSVKAQETIRASSRLAMINNDDAAKALGLIIILFSTAASLYLLLLIISFWIIWRSANQLQKEESRNEAILSGIGDAVFAIDTSGKVILFNKAAASITGFPETEVLGQPYKKVLKFIDEKTSQTKDGFISLALKGKKNNMAENTSLVTKSGQVIPVADSAAPFNDSEEVIGAVVVFRDVTKEREVDKAKDEFISLASHQLRTPLTAIRLYSEMMGKEKSALGPKLSEYSDIIHESTLRMIKLVGDILNVSRIQLGSLRIEPQPTALKTLIQSVIDEIVVLAKEKKIEINFTALDLPEVNVDPMILRQVVHNLLTNALRYSNPNTSISVSLALADKKSKDYLISVKDEGIGIPKTVQDKIFTRFFRADNAIRKEGDGTGLGMYMAKMIMDTVGGKIWFESEENKGTVFYVIIPKKGMIKKQGTKTLS